MNTKQKKFEIFIGGVASGIFLFLVALTTVNHILETTYSFDKIYGAFGQLY